MLPKSDKKSPNKPPTVPSVCYCCIKFLAKDDFEIAKAERQQRTNNPVNYST